jgi:hypothetical protein
LKGNTCGTILAAIVAALLAGSPARAGVTCVSKSGPVSKTGGSNVCFAGSDGSSKATSTANRGGTAIAAVANGGKAHANANGNDSLAEAHSDQACVSRATASGADIVSFAVCTVDGGSAKTVAAKGGDASAEADERCDVRAKSVGEGSVANADCSTPGGFVHSMATGGAIANGTDTAPPTCDTSHGGKARVRSSGGNCG